MTVEIKGKDRVYRGWTSITKLTLTDGRDTFTREIEDHGDGVAVLPYDPERRVALLVRMPRAPVLAAGAADILEVPAGLIDDGEDHETGARREAAEEAGVTLGALHCVGTIWTCPGISTERMTLYLAPYRSADRTGTGGGLAHEHENITVVEMPLADLKARAETGRLTDLKTYALLQTLRLRHPELF